MPPMMNSRAKWLVLLYSEPRLDWLSTPVNVEEKANGVSILHVYGVAGKSGGRTCTYLFPLN